MTKINDAETKLAVVVEKVSNIESKLIKIEARLDAEYVTRGEMDARVALLENKLSLVEKVVYGMVALVLTGVGGAFLTLILK